MTEQITNHPIRLTAKRIVINGQFNFHARTFSGLNIQTIERQEVLICYRKLSDVLVAVRDFNGKLLGFARPITGVNHG